MAVDDSWPILKLHVVALQARKGSDGSHPKPYHLNRDVEFHANAGEDALAVGALDLDPKKPTGFWKSLTKVVTAMSTQDC